MNKRKLLQVITLSFSLIALPAMAQKTYHVNINSGDDSNDGLKWSAAFKNIQSAINAATEGDNIYVAAGTYYPTLKIADIHGGSTNPGESTTDVNRSFLFTKNVKFYGGFPSNASDATDMNNRDWTLHQTVLSGDFNNDDTPDFQNMDENALHVIVLINPTSDMTMDGFHITGGGGDETKFIGTVYVDDTPVFQRCGGGIYAYSNQSSSPTFSNLVISNNKASLDGGGVYYYAGGINANASPTLNNVSILNNFAAERGGGFYNRAIMEAKPTLHNVIITGNEAVEGAGFLCFADSKECSPVFENVLVSGNKAKNLAGVYLFAMETNAYPTITNTTICGNYASDRDVAGGMYIVATGDVRPVIQNSVIWGNKGSQKEFHNIVFWSQYGSVNPIFTHSLVEDMDLGETNLDGNTDPMFVNPVNADFAPTTSDFGNYRLLPTSPLINKGNNDDASLLFDLDGQNRIYGDVIDIGAFEAQTIEQVNNEIVLTHNPAIWSHQGNLYVKINKNTATVRVYSINGTLTKQINNLGEGTHALSLPTGLYIVTLNAEEATKVFIR